MTFQLHKIKIMYNHSPYSGSLKRYGWYLFQVCQVILSFQHSPSPTSFPRDICHRPSSQALEHADNILQIWKRVQQFDILLTGTLEHAVRRTANSEQEQRVFAYCTQQEHSILELRGTELRRLELQSQGRQLNSSRQGCAQNLFR